MKYIKLIFTIFICFILCGCFLDDPKYITFETKPTTYYYSDELYSKLKENPSFTLQVFDCILYKYYDVPVDDYDIVESFLTSLHTENYLLELPDEFKENKQQYRLIISFGSSKYIINAYSPDLDTIHPYDGSFQEDIIDSTKNVDARNNIYDFCVYVINKAQSN
ncbi:DUF4883 family protein [Clostridium sp. 29_15]|uniref:DUF4883 family protein n=1 Tax=Clostridium sp. 29_15 TaxID=1896982 RepID=UPI00095B1534|nr:DUF4883 family protein [Clostridium sp. 29_15]OKZ87351.1 MAG: hypothetical protein BHW04_05730 [Clostridium sp. 29_15]